MASWALRDGLCETFRDTQGWLGKGQRLMSVPFPLLGVWHPVQDTGLVRMGVHMAFWVPFSSAFGDGEFILPAIHFLMFPFNVR